MTTREAAEKECKELNDGICAREWRKATVMEFFKGKRSLGFAIQFRVPGDTEPTIDGEYRFEVAR